MEEEIIKYTIETVVNEIKERVDSLEGLCVYVTRTIKLYLDELGIETTIHNIKEEIGVDYDHYYLEGEYFIIDPTYSQFTKKEGRQIIAFSYWPSEVLKSKEKGEELLQKLLADGYFNTNEYPKELYLESFIGREKNKKR